MKANNFLTDSKGNLSSIRLLMLVVMLLLIIDWLFSLYTTGTYVISWEKVSLICAVFSLKVAQKPFEEKYNDTEIFDVRNNAINNTVVKKSRRKY